MKAFLLAAALSPAALGAAADSIEVPPHFTFREKPHVCAECGTVREIYPHNRRDERPGKGLVIGSVVGAPAKRVDHGTYVHITIDMDNGKTREINVDDATGLEVGAKIRVVNGNDIEPLAATD